MRVLGHHCVRVIPEHPSTVNFDVVCSCGSVFAGPIEHAINAFCAHVIGHIALAALDRERDATSETDQPEGDRGER